MTNAPTPEPLGTCERLNRDHPSTHLRRSDCFNWKLVAPTPPVPGEPTLLEIMTGLSEVYDDKGCVIWLRAEQRWVFGNAVWSRSALVMIIEGRTAEVMQRVDQLRIGSYA